jgi:DNA-binding NtrC family response regulator
MPAMPEPGDPFSAQLPHGRARVLVVDDSRAQRRILTLQLRRWGYDVSEAETGDAALALCRSQTFDIVMSDWVFHPAHLEIGKDRNRLRS